MKCQMCGGTGVWPNCCEFCGIANSVNYSIFKIINQDGKPIGWWLWRVWLDGTVCYDGMESLPSFAEFVAIIHMAKVKAEVGYVEPSKRVKVQQDCIVCGQITMIRAGLETCDQCVADFRKKWKL